MPGQLFVGHVLQKIVPPELSPRLLAANGQKQTASGFSAMGLEQNLGYLLLSLIAPAGATGLFRASAPSAITAGR